MRNKDAYIIAGKKNTNANELWSLYRCGCTRVRERLAENSASPKDLIRVLSMDSDSDVKSALARNNSVDLETLELLCDDEDINVRLTLAHEPSLPQSLLEKLLRDSNPYVCDSAQRTLEIVMMEETLRSNGFEPEVGSKAKLGELIWKSGIAEKESVIRCLETSLTENMHLGQVLIQELSIDRFLIVQALQLQSLIRKGKITIEHAISSLKNQNTRTNKKVN